MCGIFGIVSQKEYPFDLERFTDCLSHRGPDESGYFRAEGIGMGHRRLSIIDLSSGQQPMYNEDRSMCIVFNGEIYNYQELKSDLIKSGHKFATNSDTETILHAYEQWKDRCVEKLRGMFTFAIWDANTRTLFLAVDRLGIKPLFFANYDNRLYFASEMKAILADSNFPRVVDEQAVVSYFMLSYIPAPLTIFKNIRKLSPGHTLTWRNGDVQIRRYWDLHFEPQK